MRKGAEAATIGGDRNCSTRASLRGSRLTDQYKDETDKKLHTPRSTKNGRLHIPVADQSRHGKHCDLRPTCCISGLTEASFSAITKGLWNCMKNVCTAQI